MDEKLIRKILQQDDVVITTVSKLRYIEDGVLKEEYVDHDLLLTILRQMNNEKGS